MSQILVIGARGTVGSVLADRLESAGHRVRRASRQGGADASRVRLDLEDPASLAAAVAGVDGLFLMAPPGRADQHVLLAPAIAAARAAGVGKVVLMTAFGVEADEAIPLRRAERLLEASGLAHVILRPNWFMQNFASYWLGSILAEDAVALPAGDAAVSLVDARDIADCAAAAFADPALSHHAFALTGPEALTHADVAAQLASASGRPIRYRDIAPQALRATLLGAGLGADYADMLLGQFSLLRAGHAAALTDAVRQLTGRAPRSFRGFAEDHRHVWQR
jgi:uncharacterized protein YbjT (DUF2867 family)